MGLAILYLAVGVVMLAVLIVMVLLGHLLLAGFAFVAAIAALLSAAGRIVAERMQDPEE